MMQASEGREAMTGFLLSGGKPKDCSLFLKLAPPVTHRLAEVRGLGAPPLFVGMSVQMK
jgi:hypothetical protein